MGAIANIKAALLGYFNVNGATPDAVNLLYSTPIRVGISAAATAGTGVAESAGAVVKRPGTCKSAIFCMGPGTTAAASSTDYATIYVYKRVGATTSLLFSMSSAATAIEAGTSRTMTAATTSTNLVLATGDSITYEIVKTASGVATYAGSVSIEYEQTD